MVFRKQSLGVKYAHFCWGVVASMPFQQTYLNNAAAKSLQSCPTLCDPIDGSPPGSPVPGILQARTLEWVAISFSNPPKWKVKVKLLSRVWLLATPWTTDYQAPPSMGFSRQEYWSGVPLPSPYLNNTHTQMHIYVNTHSYLHLCVHAYICMRSGMNVHTDRFIVDTDMCVYTHTYLTLSNICILYLYFYIYLLIY